MHTPVWVKAYDLSVLLAAFFICFFAPCTKCRADSCSAAIHAKAWRVPPTGASQRSLKISSQLVVNLNAQQVLKALSGKITNKLLFISNDTLSIHSLLGGHGQECMKCNLQQFGP